MAAPPRQQAVPSIHFQGRLDLAIFRRAWWLHLRRALPGWQALVTVYGLIAALGLAAAVSERDLAAARSTLGITLLALLLVAWFDWSTRRAWRRREDLHQPLRGLLDTEGMEISSGYETTRISWSDLDGWIGAKDTLLLVKDQTLHLLSPELFATAEEWESARHLVHSAVPAHERQGRPAWHPVVLVAVVVLVLTLLWAFVPLVFE